MWAILRDVAGLETAEALKPVVGSLRGRKSSPMSLPSASISLCSSWLKPCATKRPLLIDQPLWHPLTLRSICCRWRAFQLPSPILHVCLDFFQRSLYPILPVRSIEVPNTHSIASRRGMQTSGSVETAHNLMTLDRVSGGRNRMLPRPLENMTLPSASRMAHQSELRVEKGSSCNTWRLNRISSRQSCAICSKESTGHSNRVMRGRGVRGVRGVGGATRGSGDVLGPARLPFSFSFAIATNPSSPIDP